MEARDFRIGNLVEKTGIVCRVIEIKEDGMVIKPLEEGVILEVGDNIREIKITAERLKKLGFKNGVAVRYREKRGHWRKKNLSIYWEIGKGFRLYGKGIKIKSFHQLQNIYFALNGTELEVKNGI